MRLPIVLPKLGNDSEQPAVLSVWFADLGEEVYEGDRLVEVLVAGASFDVAAPADGRLAEITAFPDSLLQAGQVLGWVEVVE
jgi:pyruvate/2-oxoglutarate dehydrogenase complex dihydrolipoamide acyltransferase (E2) component